MKKGISLIVLVITIIVMIIIAGAIILSLTSNGIISKAKDAVSTSDEATVKELAELAWADAYIDGVRTVEDTDGVLGFRSRIEKALDEEQIDKDEFLINVTTKGVNVKLLKNAWVKKGTTVVKGTQVMNIGDTVNYDEKIDTYNGTWKVLGADADGNLLVMSSRNIKEDFTLGSSESLSAAQNDFMTGVAKLNAECEPYGKGKGVVGTARSITVEDVNAIVAYNPEEVLYGKDRVYQYGNIVTYTYNGTITPAYTSTATGTATRTLSSEHTNGFNYFDGEKFITITDLATGTVGKQFAKIKSNFYYYHTKEVTGINSTDNPEAFSMLFGTNNAWYWLATQYTNTDGNYVKYGLFMTGNGYVMDHQLWTSVGNPASYKNGIRAVVTLSSDINFTGSSAEGWSY